MYSKRYFNINKYCALAFVVFAVLSGISDNYKANSIASINKDFPYLLKINQFLVQNTSIIRAHLLINKYEDYSVYVQSIINSKDISYYAIAGLSYSLLIFIIFYTNNKLLQNNIWRKAVF